jgi:hypothetical protein
VGELDILPEATMNIELCNQFAKRLDKKNVKVGTYAQLRNTFAERLLSSAP